uniref:Uncharacterized protein n=1 Tax=Tetraselmis sp. GSL018 TaxID=582737 RepID=A0A061RSI5_9CHLO|mmetsp:Transcript_10469/g.24776  ORF Transcript_10469/g.24776 Transcript_10469/m.24776 type:complete len:652 (-) Transcript_10469:308-2263(-)
MFAGYPHGGQQQTTASGMPAGYSPYLAAASYQSRAPQQQILCSGVPPQQGFQPQVAGYPPWVTQQLCHPYAMQMCYSPAASMPMNNPYMNAVPGQLMDQHQQQQQPGCGFSKPCSSAQATRSTEPARLPARSGREAEEAPDSDDQALAEAKRQYDAALLRHQQRQGADKAISAKNGALSGLSNLPSLSGPVLSGTSSRQRERAGDDTASVVPNAAGKPRVCDSGDKLPTTQPPSKHTDDYLLRLLKGPRKGGACSPGQKLRTALPPRPAASHLSGRSSQASLEHFPAPATPQRAQRGANLAREVLQGGSAPSRPGISGYKAPADKGRRGRGLCTPEQVKTVIGDQEFHGLRSLMMKQLEQFTDQVWELHRSCHRQHQNALALGRPTGLAREPKAAAQPDEAREPGEPGVRGERPEHCPGWGGPPAGPYGMDPAMYRQACGGGAQQMMHMYGVPAQDGMPPPRGAGYMWGQQLGAAGGFPPQAAMWGHPAAYDAFVSWYAQHYGGAGAPPSREDLSPDGTQGASNRGTINSDSNKSSDEGRADGNNGASEPSTTANKAGKHWWKDPVEVFGAAAIAPAMPSRMSPKEDKIECDDEKSSAHISKGPVKLSMKSGKRTSPMQKARPGRSKKAKHCSGNASSSICSDGSASAPCE